MQQLAPEYLAEIARQILSLAGFLGGFAATFAAMLLPSQSRSRAVAWSITGAAASAVSFIIAVVAATMILLATHPKAPPNLAPAASLERARIVAAFAFLFGLYCLIGSIGLSGWLRSIHLGRITSSIAIAGCCMVTWALLGF